MPHQRAYKESKKSPFVKALSRLGTIKSAARASRISVDAVRDWRRRDESFERMFQNALKTYRETDRLGIDSALSIFMAVARRAVPADYIPRLTAELAIAVANIRNDLIGGARSLRAPSGNKVEFSLSPKRLEGVAIPDRGNGNSAANL